MLNNYFDKIYLINLKRRNDRLNNFIDLSKKFNFNFELKEAFDGINGIDENFTYGNKKISYTRNEYYNPLAGDSMGIPNYHMNYFKGQIGCLISHLEVIKDAKNKNYKSILVFEDDVSFVENFNERLKNLMESVDQNWDMLYLSGSIPQFLQNHNFYSKVSQIHTTHSYSLKDSVYDNMIKLLTKNIFSKPVDSSYASIHDSINTYVAIPYLTYQSDGFSDIQNQNTNYTSTKIHL